MEKKDLKNKSEVETKQLFSSALQELLTTSGVSKDAVALKTRISRNYIEALCQGKLEQLPGRIFGRGFIQCIAKMVKSDSKELLRLYDECWATLETFKPTSAVPKYENRPQRRATFAFNKFILGSVIAALLITIVGFLGLRPLFRKKAPMAKVSKSTAVMPATAIIPPVAALPSVAQSSAEIPMPVASSAVSADALKSVSAEISEEKTAQKLANLVAGFVQFEVNDSVMIKTVVDGKASEYKLFQAGSHKLEFSETAELLIKDASLVEVNYNGKSLGDLGKKGRMRRLVFENTTN